MEELTVAQIEEWRAVSERHRSKMLVHQSGITSEINARGAGTFMGTLLRASKKFNSEAENDPEWQEYVDELQSDRQP